ncbi:MAG: hypothetical protein ACRCV9_16450 [Burkholderiaceae bacterium]
MSTQPVPFVIKQFEGGASAASNGSTQVMAPDAGSRMFLRRGIRGLQTGCVADKVLPQLNQLAGDLLAQQNMPAAELRARLHILMAACETPQPQNVEICVVELDGVRAYVQEDRVIVTRQDITV